MTFNRKKNPSPAAPAPSLHSHLADDALSQARQPESLATLFWTIFGLSLVAWGGLALIAQLEQHYVEREARLSKLAFSDLVVLAWMAPGAVGCNVAVQIGYTLRASLGAWVAGAASVLPFFIIMSAFALFYRTAFISTIAAPALLNHFFVALAVLIALTWYKQLHAFVRGRLQWLAAIVASVVLIATHTTAVIVLLLSASFMAGWFTSPASQEPLTLSLSRSDKILLVILTVFILLFALPLPPNHALSLLWLRLAGAAMTLFGGGFAALPILKTLFNTPAVGISNSDFTLAFTLSAISPGPLLNVLPFLGYLTKGWLGAISATVAFFVPSGWLIVFANRHRQHFRRHTRFEGAMRVLRATSSAFLIAAVVRIAVHTPTEPVFLVTAAFAALFLGKFKWPVYSVYLIIAGVYGFITFLRIASLP